MAQDPILVDQVKVEPGAAGTRLIRRAADGSLEFVDALIPDGITLSKLAGFQSMQNVLVVGKAGAGAGYLTVQAAIDAIPAGASEANPYLVIIGPGVYKETITITRNGVFLIGLGGVYLKSAAEDTPDGAGANHTLIIQAGGGSTPKKVVLQNLNISNVHGAYACVRIIGGAASQVGLIGIELTNCLIAPVAAAGNKGIWATSMDNLVVESCWDTGDTGLSLHYIQDCAAVHFRNSTLPALEFIAAAAGTLPSLGLVGSSLSGCVIGRGSSLNPVVSGTLTGLAGTFDVYGGAILGNVVVAGDGAVSFNNVTMGDLTINNTAELTLHHVHRETLAVAAGTTLSESVQKGTVAFNNETFKDVTFPAAQPDTNYAVLVEFDDDPASWWWVTNKATTGFRINLGGVGATATATWTAVRV